jgi:hypothetical protein
VGEIREHYVTFGQKYALDERHGELHPLGMHKDGYAVIEAPDLETAQRMAGAIFGESYAFIYDVEHFIFDGTKERWYSHDNAELLRIAWIEPWVGGAAGALL